MKIIACLLMILFNLSITLVAATNNKQPSTRFAFNETWAYGPKHQTARIGEVIYQTLKFEVSIDFFSWKESDYQIFSPRLPKNSPYKIYFGYLARVDEQTGHEESIKGPQTQADLIKLGETLIKQKVKVEEPDEKFGVYIELPNFSINGDVKNLANIALSNQAIKTINITLSEKGVKFEDPAKTWDCMCPRPTGGILIEEPLIIVITDQKDNWQCIIYADKKFWLKAKN